MVLTTKDKDAAIKPGSVRLGIIDLGTNSVRFDVYQVDDQSNYELLHREKLMVRLGQGVFLNQKLDPEAIARTVHAFSSFKRTATQLKTERVLAFATSALREADNATTLIKQLQKSSKISIRIISGITEARLIAHGILSLEQDLPADPFLTIDIGGGSTELSVCRNHQAIESVSLPLGVARAQQTMLKHIPPVHINHPGDSVEALRAYALDMASSFRSCFDFDVTSTALASSGSARSLQKLLQDSDKTPVSIDKLSAFIDNIKTMTRERLLKIPNLEAKRVDLILAGSIILEAICRAFGVNSFRATDIALREGLLLQVAEAVKRRGTRKLAFDLDDFYQLTRRFSVSERHARNCSDFCDELFDKTKSFHGLTTTWKTYLLAAATVHDVGKAISPIKHEEHSYYIVQHADMPHLEPWQTDFVAFLCLHHKGGGFKKSTLPFADDKDRINAFNKLLAMLRLADAVVTAINGPVRIKKAVKAEDDLCLVLDPAKRVKIAPLIPKQKRKLFEKEFQCHLALKLADSETNA